MTRIDNDNAGGAAADRGFARRPTRDEAGDYYFTYIDQVAGDDVLAFFARQDAELAALLGGISEERSLHRYAADKWSIRESWSHVVDAERLFSFRALWFARGLEPALPSYDQDVAAKNAAADGRSWASHVEEFAAVRKASRTFFESLEPAAWDVRGVASEMTFSVRALAWNVAGHAEHHARILRERYLAE
jgi:hypothetical protein